MSQEIPLDDHNYIWREDSFDMSFLSYFHMKDNKVSEGLNKRTSSIKDGTATYRQINSWEELGIVHCERPEGGWRRFSIIDIVWIEIIKQLREFGFGLKQIKRAKLNLEWLGEQYGKPMPILEFYTAFILKKGMDVNLIVFNSGQAEPITQYQYRGTEVFFKLKNHLTINLTDIIHRILPNIKKVEKPITTEKSSSITNSIDILPDSDELALLAFLRLSNYDRVEIRYKDGKIAFLEGMQRLTGNHVRDLLCPGSYANIETIIADGKIIETIKKIRKKLN